MGEQQTRYTSIVEDEKNEVIDTTWTWKVLDDNLSQRSHIMYCDNLPNL